MSQPLISVIVPVYKVERYLRKCLDSICGQSYPNLEIICVNDGSPEGEQAILEEYAARDKRIRVIRQENRGLGAARNVGIAAATGEWITGVDSDDWLEKDTYERAVAATGEDTDCVCFGISVDAEKEGMSTHGTQQYCDLKFEGYQCEVHEEHLYKTNVHFWNKLYRRSLIRRYELKQTEGKLYEDAAFFFSYFSVCRAITYVSYPGYHYLQREASIMGATKRKTERGLDHLDVIRDYYHFLQRTGLYSRWEQIMFWVHETYYTCTINSIPPSTFRKANEQACEIAHSIGFDKRATTHCIRDRRFINRCAWRRFFHDCRNGLESFGFGRFHPLKIAYQEHSSTILWRGRVILVLPKRQSKP